MPETLALLIGIALAGAVVLAPLIRRRTDEPQDADDLEAAALRHRVAIEALRDVGTDRSAGSLDDAGYALQLAEAEEHAAVTRAALERASSARVALVRASPSTAPAIAAALVIGSVLVVGSAVPVTGIGNRTVVNRELADAQASESMRQQRADELRSRLAEDPRDADALSELADVHLAGSSREDLVRAAVALQLLIQLEPERADAYERILSAYLRAGDAANARAAHDAYSRLESADPVEVAFYDGLIALRGENDRQRALEAFDAFLQMAPDDPRAGMIRGLRDEAAAAP